MERRHFLRSAILALVAMTLMSGNSQARASLVIDTFADSQSATDTTMLNGRGVTSNAAAGSVFGGQRRLIAHKSGPLFPLFAPISLSTGGALTFDQAGDADGVSGTATLIYDGYNGNTGGGQGTSVDPTNIADTDLTINGGDMFVLRDLAVLGDGIDLTIDVYDGPSVSTFTTELANSPTPTDFYVLFSAFSDPSVFTSVNAIALTFDGLTDSGSQSGQGSDLSFTELATSAPEPSGLAMLGIALAGMLYRRRRHVRS